MLLKSGLCNILLAKEMAEHTARASNAIAPEIPQHSDCIPSGHPLNSSKSWKSIWRLSNTQEVTY